jgi:hypothetical protein
VEVGETDGMEQQARERTTSRSWGMAGMVVKLELKLIVLGGRRPATVFGRLGWAVGEWLRRREERCGRTTRGVGKGVFRYSRISAREERGWGLRTCWIGTIFSIAAIYWA